MTNDTATPIASIATLSFDQALEVCTTENGRFAVALGAVQPGQWALPTDCDLWTVRDLVGHVLGSLDTNMSTVRGGLAFARASWRAKRNGTEAIDEATKAEVQAYAHVPASELVATFNRLAPRNIAGRRRTPTVLRRVAMTFEGYRLSLGELASITLTRDLWMHRIDLCRATAQPVEITADHDGRIVEDVVASWAARHGRPFDLRLTGPAGGWWSRAGDGAESIEMDAVEFCRTLAGRRAGTGLLETKVVF